jgi:DNA repair protein RecO (recombination protein O)
MTRSDRITLQPGFVLQLRPYRDTSALVEIFTRDAGRVGLVARGARRPKQGAQGTLQPFQPILVSWAGRGDLGTLTSVEADGLPPSLKGKALFCSYYLNELLLRLLARHDPHPRLHADYGVTIARLAQAEDVAALEQALRIFEKRLLQELGYGLLLEQEAEGGVPVDPGRMYSYRLEKGPLPGEDPTGMQVQGRTLLGLASEDIEDAECLREAKRLLRAALALYLGDRPLRSREFFRKAAAGSSRDAPSRPAAPSE